MDLDERKQKILSAIVEQFIRTGEPVGSKKIAEMMNFKVSPATIRNDMAVLFDRGLLEQPHTSAGRVPSHLGYRVYINNLMRCIPMSQQEQAEIDSVFNVMNPDPDKLMADAAKTLAEMTGCVSITSTFTPKTVFVSRVELIPATDRTVVILVIASNGVIKNKVCRVMFRVNAQICEFFTSFVNDRLQGRSLNEISMWYLNSISVDLGEYSALFNPLLASVYELCKEINDGQFYIEGQTNLLAYPELADTVSDLLLMFTDKEKVLSALPSGEQDMIISIGKENHKMELADSSVMLARYSIGGNRCGVVGLIGPIRLNYAKLVPNIAYFAQLLGTLLSDTFEQQEAKGE
ncbi:MAG: heat-inducible transcription repressor HrcA [Oscillospiraceae bacterium]|nr:heat-inducible transcription repressor HrcA [Oscillospiraceae bacterium]